MFFFCLKGGDNIYSIFGDNVANQDYFNEEAEDILIDWILSTFEKYQENPPEGAKSPDDIAKFITKEFNVRKYIYETGSNQSIENLEKVLEMEIDKKQAENILEKIGEQTPKNEHWVSEVRIFEILTDYHDIALNDNVVVMHPEINEEMGKSK